MSSKNNKSMQKTSKNTSKKPLASKKNPSQKTLASLKKNSSSQSFLSHLKQFWDYVWNGTSVLSWILAVFFTFIFVRFIIYPLAGLLLGTSLPLVAVISGSMQQGGDFDDWWNSSAVCEQRTACTQAQWYAEKNISKEEFSVYTLPRGFNKGDLILLHGKKPDRIRLGDVLVFSAQTPYPVIHRVVSISTNTTNNSTRYVFETKGDANWYQITSYHLDETNIYQEQILGLAYARIPYLGYLKLWLVDGLSSLTQMTTTPAPSPTPNSLGYSSDPIVQVAG